MKSWEVKISLVKGGTVDTVVQAKNRSDTKRLAEAQYGNTAKAVWGIREVR